MKPKPSKNHRGQAPRPRPPVTVARGAPAKAGKKGRKRPKDQKTKMTTPMLHAPVGTVPEAWNHQEKALDFIEDKPGAMLAMYMGLGKTKCAIDHANRIGAKRILTLAPLSIVDHVWEDQVRKHSRTPIRVQALGQSYKSTKKKVEAGNAAIIGTSKTRPVMIVANYECVLRKEFQRWVSSIDWDLFILDEIHRIKAPGGAMSLWIAQFARQVPNRLGLTGTPMPHSPLDLYAQFRALDPTVFGNSYSLFERSYAVLAEKAKQLGFSAPGLKAQDKPDYKKVLRYKNAQDLREKYLSIAYEVDKDEAIKLPGTQTIEWRVGMTPEAKATYDDLDRLLAAEIFDGQTVKTPNPLAQLTRLQQLTSGFVETKDVPFTRVDNAKSQALADLIGGIHADDPVVVFARFLPDLDEIKRIAEEEGRPAWEHSGRSKQLEQWNSQGGVLAVQIQAGGSGLDLTNARYCIYYSLGFSLGDYEQSKARLHRPGQERYVTYYHLIAAGTIDEVVMASLEGKQDVIRTITNAKSLRPPQTISEEEQR